MTLRARPIVACLIASTLGSFTFAEFIACSGAGPDAPARSNGCISEGCFADGGDNGASGGLTDSPIARTNPLQGITPVATLVKGGFQVVGGPVWVGNRLVFSDVAANTMHQLLSDGSVAIFRGNSGGANGNAVDASGQLVTCEGRSRRVTRSNPQLENPQAIATLFAGKRYNEPNDVVTRADGTVYFTDPSYTQVDAGQDDEAVYRLPSGAAPTAAERLAFDFKKPTGIALSPDGRTLYVVDTGDQSVLAAQLTPDGAIDPDNNGRFRKFTDAVGGNGLAVDDLGNLYIAATAGVLVVDKAGVTLGTIALPEGKPSNCAFGGADRKTLYVTSNVDGSAAASGVYQIKLNVPGLP